MKQNQPGAVVPLAQAAALLRAGQVAAAEAAYRAALASSTDPFAALLGLGVCLAQQRRPAEAVPVFERAVASSTGPQRAMALANLGNVLQEMGDHDRALAVTEEALRIAAPQAAAMRTELLVNLGTLLAAVGRHHDSIQVFETVLHGQPDHARARKALAGVLEAAQRPDEALAQYERVLASAPNDTMARYNHSVLLQRAARWEQSAQGFRRVLQDDAGHADAWLNLGIVERQRGQLVSALECADRALGLRPDWPMAHRARAHALQELRRLDDACAAYSRSLALDARDAGAWLCRADCQRLLGRLDDAIHDYQQAITLDPQHPDSAKLHVNLATCLFLLGRFEQAWPHAEWRWGDAQIHPPHRYPLATLWLGDHPVQGRRVLVHCEQGYGDTLQFCRYLPMLAGRGATVLVEAPKALHGMLARLEGVQQLFTRQDAVPPHDLHVPTLSLPMAFNTTLASIPATIPYLRSAAARRDRWRQQLGAGARIGLVWSGNPAHGNDANRSIRLDLVLACIARSGLPASAFVSLQHELKADEQTLLDDAGIASLGTGFDDFDDTAAVIDQLDLLISVDTSPVHLAGALGRPVWLLLPHTPDWRWLLDRGDSPWYPSVRLFRQAADCRWEPVLDAVAQALPGQAARSAPQRAPT